LRAERSESNVGKKGLLGGAGVGGRALGGKETFYAWQDVTNPGAREPTHRERSRSVKNQKSEKEAKCAVGTPADWQNRRCACVPRNGLITKKVPLKLHVCRRRGREKKTGSTEGDRDLPKKRRKKGRGLVLMETFNLVSTRVFDVGRKANRQGGV